MEYPIITHLVSNERQYIFYMTILKSIGMIYVYFFSPKMFFFDILAHKYEINKNGYLCLKENCIPIFFIYKGP